MLKELKHIPSLLFFPFANSPTRLRLIAMSDASFAPTSRYGQRDIFIWLTHNYQDRLSFSAIESLQE
jgi:hypothetical protein